MRFHPRNHHWDASRLIEWDQAPAWLPVLFKGSLLGSSSRTTLPSGEDIRYVGQERDGISCRMPWGCWGEFNIYLGFLQWYKPPRITWTSRGDTWVGDYPERWSDSGVIANRAEIWKLARCSREWNEPEDNWLKVPVGIQFGYQNAAWVDWPALLGDWVRASNEVVREIT